MALEPAWRRRDNRVAIESPAVASAAMLFRHLGFCLCLLAAGCQRSAPVLPSAAEEPPLTVQVDEGPRDFPGLHNVCGVTQKLLSGGNPEGDAGFQSLRRLGVRTIISVDGARPDVERARQFELRYVHLPIGYDGVPREQALRLARAVRDLPGLVYIHCHHGKHRSPAAAVAVRRCLDGQCSTQAAVALLKRAGTGPNYTGLYAAAEQFMPISDAELDRVPADFPEVAQVNDLVKLMVEIDKRFEHLKQMRSLGWKAPADHPDLDPAHEALLLREAYAESARLPGASMRSEELRHALAEAEQLAAKLEAVLRSAQTKPEIDEAYRRVAASCTHCHARHRDSAK